MGRGLGDKRLHFKVSSTVVKFVVMTPKMLVSFFIILLVRLTTLHKHNKAVNTCCLMNLLN